MRYDIFISYRREGGYDTAKHLNDLLVRDHYKVSFDIDTLRSGDFDVQLLNRIEECKDFILIVDKHAFDWTLDENTVPEQDWLRQELAHALKYKKNIIPVFLSGVSGFPEGLPDDICGVVKKNGPEFNKYYFNDFYRKLKKRFLKSKSFSPLKISIVIILVIIMVIMAVLYSQKKADYISGMLSKVTEVVKSDVYLGFSLLYEALPKSVADSFSVKLLKPSKEIKTDIIDWDIPEFSDNCVINESGTKIASSSYGEEIIVRDFPDIKNGYVLKSNSLSLIGARQLTFNSTQEQLALINTYVTSSLIVFDLKKKEQVKEIKLDDLFIRGVLFCGNNVAVLSNEKILLVDVVTEIQREINYLEDIITMAFNPIGSRLLILCKTGIFLYDLEKQEIVKGIMKNNAHGTHVCYSSCGKYAYINDKAGGVAKYDAEELSEISRVEVTGNNITALCVGDGKVYAGDEKGNLYSIDYETRQVEKMSSSHTSAINIVKWNNYLFSYSQGRIELNMNVCNVAYYDALHKDKLSAFFYDDSVTIIGNRAGDIIIDAPKIHDKKKSMRLCPSCKKKGYYGIVSINRIQEDRYIVSCGHRVNLIDIKNLNVIDGIENYIDYVDCVGSNIYVSGYDEYVSKYKINDSNKFELESKFYCANPEDDINAFELSKDNKILLYSQSEKIYYNINEEQRLLYVGEDDIEEMIVSKNDSLVYILSDDCVKCFSIIENKTRFSLPKDDIDGFALSSDDEYLVTYSYPEIIDVWDARTGTHLKEIGGDFVIELIEFDNTSSKLFVLTQNYGLVQLDMFMDSLEIETLKQKRRKLTKREREIYGVNKLYSFF